MEMKNMVVQWESVKEQHRSIEDNKQQFHNKHQSNFPLSKHQAGHKHRNSEDYEHTEKQNRAKRQKQCRHFQLITDDPKHGPRGYALYLPN